MRFIAICGLLIASFAHAQALPDDSQKYYLITVSADPAGPSGVALATQLSTHPALAKIAASCKLFQFKATDEIYKTRYAAQLPAVDLPIIALARSDGGVLYKASGNAIPQPDSLASALTAAAAADRAANHRESAMVTGFPHIRPLDGSRLIPDTITVTPDFGPYVGIAAGALCLLLLGSVLLAIVVGLVFLFNQ